MADASPDGSAALNGNGKVRAFWLRQEQYSGAKDTRGHAFFRSVVWRWIWRLYTQRLTKAGRWLLWPCLTFLGYSITTLELQAYVPFAYAFGLWFMALAATLLFRPKVRLNTVHAERVCAGEVLPVEAEVEQCSRLGGIDLRILPHRLPPEIDPAPLEGALLPPLAKGDKARARLGLRCNRRGVYSLPGFKVESDFPFGIFRAYTHFPAERSVLVYPRFSPLARFEMPSGRRYQPGGVALASVLGDSTEFIGDREYREGDNVRDIDWRATARLNKLIVREYREEYFVRVAIVLDTHVSKHSAASRRENFEHAVSVSAAIGDYLSRQEYIVDIFAAGPNLYHLTAGRGLAYLDQILDILACVESHPTEPFEALEPELIENLSQISAIVAVFLDWDETRRAFVQNLRSHGVAVKVVVVHDGLCTLDPSNESGFPNPVATFSSAEIRRGLEEI
ncbi:MAG: DUF58 domain-containing protein [Planctomycetes bacterium]|nr:DUF58 domain-containing protein [Planctomycetota bacterium]